MDYDKVLNWSFPEIEHRYGARESILYALGLGFGADPTDERQLDFVFEEADFKAVPSMAVVLGSPGFWARNPDTGIDWRKILHGEQGFVIHRPLPPEGTLIGRTKVTDILDKGAGKGALIYVERQLLDKETGSLMATLTSTTFARGDGGFGGAEKPAPTPHSVPERAPDHAVDLPTLPQSALIYRLSGDFNPLHASPSVARGAGFDRPILHGLCTLGVAGHALLKEYCAYEVSRFKEMHLRFASPVYPGETIRTESWKDGDVISFQARVVERDKVVLSNGRAVIGPG